MTSSTSPTSSGSSADVISSSSSTLGRMASARAIATRCCCPPERCAGYADILASSPTRASNRRPSWSASAADTRWENRGPSSTLSSTVMWGKRLYCWNTMPICCRCRRASASDTRCRLPSGAARYQSGSPSSWIAPASYSSRKLMQRRSVVLPHPLRPMSATTSPSSISRSIPCSTRTLPNDFRSPRMAIMCALPRSPSASSVVRAGGRGGRYRST